MPAYIDHKLASFESFATPTYFQPPFAKPVDRSAGPQPRATEDDPRRREGAAPLRVPGSTRRRRTPTARASPTLDKVAKKKHGDRFAEARRADADEAARRPGGRQGRRASRSRRTSSRWCSRTSTRGCSPTRSTAGTATSPAGSSSAIPARSAPTRRTSSMHGPQHKRVQGLRDMPAMNPGVPQDHAILPLAGTRQTEGAVRWPSSTPRSTSSRSARAGPRRSSPPSSARTGRAWSRSSRAAHAGRTRTSRTTTTASATRCATRMMVDLQRETWTWRPEPERARAADAPVRHRSTPGRASAARPCTGRRSSGATSRPTSATARTSSSATARRRSRTAAPSRTGASPTTSSSRTTTRSSGTSAPPARPGTSTGKKIPGGNPFESPRSRGYPEPSARRSHRTARTSPTACDEPRPAPVHAAVRRSPRAPGPTRTATTAAAASTAASARASAARSTRRRAR